MECSHWSGVFDGDIPSPLHRSVRLTIAPSTTFRKNSPPLYRNATAFVHVVLFVMILPEWHQCDPNVRFFASLKGHSMSVLTPPQSTQVRWPRLRTTRTRRRAAIKEKEASAGSGRFRSMGPNLEGVYRRRCSSRKWLSTMALAQRSGRCMIADKSRIRANHGRNGQFSDHRQPRQRVRMAHKRRSGRRTGWMGNQGKAQHGRLRTWRTARDDAYKRRSGHGRSICMKGDRVSKMRRIKFTPSE